MNAICLEWNALQQIDYSTQVTSILRANLFSGGEVLT
jgi:hypothetical protein